MICVHSPGGFRSVVDTDLMGTYPVFRAGFDIIGRPGSMIAITSGLATHPMPQQVHACAAKAGVNMVIKVLAMEWGQVGIRVNGISPGPIAGSGGLDRLIPTLPARDAIQAPFVVDDIVKRGWTKVAVFADTTGYGEAGLKDVEKALEAKKLKAVHIARFAIGVKDLSAELKAARDAGAEVVFSYTVGQENAVIAKGRQALGWKVPQVGAWTLSFPFFIDGAKEAADGALMAQTFIAEPSNERRASFLTAYARRYKGARLTVPMAAAQSYDATYLLMYSLFGVRDGTINGPVLKKALENMARTYYGVVGTYEKPFSLNDKDAITQNMLVMGMVKNGAVTFAYPEDAKRNLFVQRKQ